MDAQEIGRRLVSLRGKKLQKEVAKAIGVSCAAISMYERGDRIPKDSIKKRLADYYNTTVETIFFAEKLHV